MSCLADAAQIDLRFCDPARGLMKFCAFASPPAIARASASTSSANTGSEQTGKLNPCRSALRAARQRPYRVRGPVLARKFARLALVLSSLLKPRPLLRQTLINNFELVGFNLLHPLSQHFGKYRPTAIDLAQARVAAALGNGGEAVDLLDIFEGLVERFGQENIDARAGPGEKLVDRGRSRPENKLG